MTSGHVPYSLGLFNPPCWAPGGPFQSESCSFWGFVFSFFPVVVFSPLFPQLSLSETPVVRMLDLLDQSSNILYFFHLFVFCFTFWEISLNLIFFLLNFSFLPNCSSPGLFLLFHCFFHGTPFLPAMIDSYVFLFFFFLSSRFPAWSLFPPICFSFHVCLSFCLSH